MGNIFCYRQPKHTKKKRHIDTPVNLYQGCHTGLLHVSETLLYIYANTLYYFVYHLRFILQPNEKIRSKSKLIINYCNGHSQVIINCLMDNNQDGINAYYNRCGGRLYSLFFFKLFGCSTTSHKHTHSKQIMTKKIHRYTPLSHMTK